jgi:hypothetical protein
MSCCCDAMEYAIAEGYLRRRLQAIVTDGKIKVLPPAIAGPALTKSGKKCKPDLILAFCPWCMMVLDTENT